MNESAYSKIITLLDAAKSVFAANAGDLSPADLRIRCLVNITGKEAQRALLEIGATGVVPREPARISEPRSAATKGPSSAGAGG